jgi:hypothetical protein
VSPLRRARPSIDVAVGEKVVAWADTAAGDVVAGTRDALYLEGRRLAWEDVEAADWDRDASLLRVSEVGQWGEPRVEHALALADTAVTDRLLQLVRERVTASVVLVRHVPLVGRRGVRVVARRAPRGTSPLQWVFEYDAGIDPADPTVAAAAAEALRVARDDVGLS